MTTRDRAVIKKILEEISVCDAMMGGISLEVFLEDEKLKRAVSMTILNIGELAKNISEALRLRSQEIPWKAITGFRDIAAHKYQALRMEDVYLTATEDLPYLQDALIVILHDLD